ncbi:MAG UNVERIFIED_CONTAM: hypothetical protein LVR18_28565 [Planctomycetaceae bacterium]
MTGVTMFQIEPALDSGPMIGRFETPIDPRETSGELLLRLAKLCVPFALQMLDLLERSTAVLEPQNAAEVTLARKSSARTDVLTGPCPPNKLTATSVPCSPGPKRLRCFIAKGSLRFAA